MYWRGQKSHVTPRRCRREGDVAANGVCRQTGWRRTRVNGGGGGGEKSILTTCSSTAATAAADVDVDVAAVRLQLVHESRATAAGPLPCRARGEGVRRGGSLSGKVGQSIER